MDTHNIDLYIHIGRKDIDWFAKCEDVFVELYGREKLSYVASLFAATSINTHLKSNITLFRKAMYQIENNLPIEGYVPVMQKQIVSIREGREISGRKIRSFWKAICGERNAVIVDTWLVRAFDMEKQYFRQTKGAEKGKGLMRSAGVSNKDYTLIEGFVRNKAEQLGLEPRQVSSMIWAGIRIHRNEDAETHYKTLLMNKVVTLYGVII